ncbi:IclR family transcriptional regulator [Marinicrinis lubricantis]|uniref:IclR family transcriptional regulator n=1 Tax=Marinicrinis lubricantis TaxID=2086470 RepID=A0ABW1IR67_9BACL
MEEGKSTVRSVERALDILLCFTEHQEWAMTEIASKVNLHKSTVHRLLASLEHKGFVTRNPETDKYKLGFRIWELSAHLSETDDPAIVLLPELERLRDQLEETVSLYIRDGKERIRIQAVQSRQSIRRVATVGARLPLYVGASSKVLLAFAPKEIQEQILRDEEWPDFIEKMAFEQQLAQIREIGYATSIEEREAGAAAVAVPIYDRHHQMVAALSVSGPANRLTVDKMKEHVPTLIEAARRMGSMIRP